MDFPGLSSEAARKRLREDGPNAIAEREHRGWLAIALAELKEPMFLLLLGAATIYLVLGDVREGAFLLVMVVVTLGLTFYQQGKTQRALDALRALASPAARVLRDGQLRQVDSQELVRGDVLALGEGERVPADARVLDATVFEADESLLTGESVPVTKAPGAPIFSGTLVVRGRAWAEVTATGTHSEIGRIGAALRVLEPEPGPLQRQSARLVAGLAIAGVALAGVLFVVQGIMSGNWLQAALAAIALAMSLLPEEFVIVFTVFPTLGAWRLARAQVLTRRLAAIETLGALSVLCVDKTGTLTQNRMAVAQTDPPESAAVLSLAAMASEALPYDPMETAIRTAAPPPPPDAVLEHGYPLSTGRRLMAQCWRQADGRRIAAAKGAPEAVARLCGLPTPAAAGTMAERGLRVLGVARAELPPGEEWPESPEDLRWQWSGLLALADPLRPAIPNAVAALREAGIRLLMVTGDYSATARAIADQAGIGSGAIVEGSAIATMDDAALAAALKEASICARITPDQKLRIVRALVANGEIVGMTGDGVNDAPALRAAHAGIAMGKRGTDVAREAAAVVLLEDQFEAIVDAVALGRRIFANLRKAMNYILAIHVPIAGMALFPVLLGLPPLLYPAHIVLLEMVIDSACSMSFENEPAGADAMRRPPRPAMMRLFAWRTLAVAWLQGALALAAALAAYIAALRHLPEDEARAAGFAAVVILNLLLILSSRSPRFLNADIVAPNRLLLGVFGGALGLLGVALYVPWFATLLRFGHPGWTAPLTGLAAGAAGLVLFELAKLLRREDADRAAPSSGNN